MKWSKDYLTWEGERYRWYGGMIWMDGRPLLEQTDLRQDRVYPKDSISWVYRHEVD